MPEREKAVDYLTRDYLWRSRRIADLTFDGLRGTCREAPDYYELRHEFDLVFVRLTDGINWARVLINARAHAIAMEAAGFRKETPEAEITGPDLQCAIQQDETFLDWPAHVRAKHPQRPREDS